MAEEKKSYFDNLKEENVKDSNGGVWVFKKDIPTSVANDIERRHTEYDPTDGKPKLNKEAAAEDFRAEFVVKAPKALTTEYEKVVGKPFDIRDLSQVDSSVSAFINRYMTGRLSVSVEEKDF